MVGRTGLEPVTPCASCKCATNCANGPPNLTLHEDKSMNRYHGRIGAISTMLDVTDT
jgi:hypothetical protein